MRLRTVFVCVVLTVGSVGCGGDEPSPATSTSVLRASVAAVCSAVHEAESSFDAAHTTFFDQAHDNLHELARRVTDVDPEAAAGLLEAKESVESIFRSEDAQALSGALGELVEAGNEALSGLDIPAVECTP